MRVALIYPEVYDIARFQENRKEMPPFGILYLASILRNCDIETVLFKINKDHFQLDLSEFDAIGFSISSSAIYNLVKGARFNSYIEENAFVFAGGVHVSFYPEETIIDMDLDAVCIGESEHTILDLLNNQQRLNEVSGICFQKGGNVIRTNPRSLISNIDELPFPARDMIPQNDFIMDNRLSGTNIRMTHVLCSRGCPYSCTFCANFDRKLRYRSGRNIREELIQLISEYSIEGFCIADDNFIINKSRVSEICTSISDLGLKWSALSRIDNINEDLLEVLYESGCMEIKYGIESGSQTILGKMKKNISNEQILGAISATKKVGIKVKGFLIHGFPGENLATTKETIGLLEKVEEYIDRVSVFQFVPLPGSYVYENPDKFELHGTKYNKDWDGNWEKYHIYNNDFHWWGSNDDFKEMQEGYQMLKSYVDEKWPEEYKKIGKHEIN